MQVSQCADALKRLCEEHGIENGFYASEIAEEAGLSRLLVGRVLNTVCFIDACEQRGIAAFRERIDGYTRVNTSAAKQESEQ